MFSFEIASWHTIEGLNRDAYCAFRVDLAGESITEVYDSISKTVRDYIVVPVAPFAKWLLINWWRLRWEPAGRSLNWKTSHCVAAIGGGVAWPALEFSSDGEFVQVHMEGEDRPDAAAIRFLKTRHVEIPAKVFERAVFSLVEQVVARLQAVDAADVDLEELWAELEDELNDPSTFRACQLQAMAGIDPGLAGPEWLSQVAQLASEVGEHAIDEVVAVLPEFRGNLTNARQAIDTIRTSKLHADLSWVEPNQTYSVAEPPWQRATRMAEIIRTKHGLKDGPILDQSIEELLQCKISTPGVDRSALLGGYRQDGDKVSVLPPVAPPVGSRFYFARLIGSALASTNFERLLPVTSAYTARQKFERAFAQEFLCPWRLLKPFLEEYGADEYGIQRASTYFKVSERVVVSTAVNKGFLDRRWLAAMGS